MYFDVSLEAVLQNLVAVHLFSKMLLIVASQVGLMVIETIERISE